MATLFGGSISDKEITLRSGLVEKLQYGDCIMADWGFNIQEMLASKGVSVNVPPVMNESGNARNVDIHALLNPNLAFR